MSHILLFSRRGLLGQSLRWGVLVSLTFALTGCYAAVSPGPGGYYYNAAPPPPPPPPGGPGALPPPPPGPPPPPPPGG